MLSCHQLQFAYTPNVQFTFPDIHCAAEQSLLILGESGKGKTTLLHLLAGLLRPSKGTIHIGNTDISQLNTRQLDSFRGKNIGIIFQRSHFVSALSVQDNLLLSQHLAKVPKNYARIKLLLEQLNIANKLHRKPNALSQGEQQRVAIARALLNQPKILLADEPTASLDDKNCRQVIDLLKAQAKAAKASLIIVTHDARLKEAFNRQILL